mgnify:CR=1 FL=1
MKPRFISDLHLSEKHPELTQAFFTFLNESKEACTHLYILGDLFEAWIGDDDTTPLAQEVKGALRAFTDNGPATFFIHGNRDFLVGESFAKETGITILPDPYTLEINDQKVVLSHGDFLCTDDEEYINFRNEVREQDWQSNFLSKSLNERKQIASNLRTDSKEATSKKADSITDVNEQSVLNFVNQHETDLFIHGHTHRPNIHKINIADKVYKRVVLGDWYDKSFVLNITDDILIIDKGHII